VQRLEEFLSGFGGIRGECGEDDGIPDAFGRISGADNPAFSGTITAAVIIEAVQRAAEEVFRGIEGEPQVRASGSECGGKCGAMHQHNQHFGAGELIGGSEDQSI
jgi:hypothetical protein